MKKRNTESDVSTDYSRFLHYLEVAVLLILLVWSPLEENNKNVFDKNCISGLIDIQY